LDIFFLCQGVKMAGNVPTDSPRCHKNFHRPLVVEALRGSTIWLVGILSCKKKGIGGKTEGWKELACLAASQPTRLRFPFISDPLGTLQPVCSLQPEKVSKVLPPLGSK
jgi:hypothetical protein